MKPSKHTFCFAFVVFAVMTLLKTTYAKADQRIEKTLDVPPVEQWRIEEPRVTQADTQFGQILFKPGDVVKLRAGGGVQTGGRGKTWKRYVNPSGPNSDHLYHGTVKLPGMPGSVRIQDFLNNVKT